MGFLDKLKGSARGVMTSAEPQVGVTPVSADELRRRLLAISGKGIETAEDESEVVVSWSAKVAAAGAGSAGFEYLYRALRVELEEGDSTAKGVCFKTTTEAELGASGAVSGSKSWERGQHIGTETHHVLAWLGRHHTEGGADEKGYKFSWSDLRAPVMETVTGAGWTYKPKRI